MDNFLVKINTQRDYDNYLNFCIKNKVFGRENIAYYRWGGDNYKGKRNGYAISCLKDRINHYINNGFKIFDSVKDFKERYLITNHLKNSIQSLETF